MHLRPARSTDAGAVGGLLSHFVDSTDWMPRIHSRAQDIAHAGEMIARSWVTVAEEAGQVAGFAACHAGALEALYVAAEMRRRGVASALLRHLQASEKTLTLWTFQANLPAQAFYLSHGFVEVSRSDGATTDEGLPDIRYAWQRKAE